VVPVDRLGHRRHERAAPLVLAGGGGRVVVELDAGPVGEPLDGSGEVEVLRLADEGDDITAGLAAEAVVHAEARVERERRRPLGVERAQTLQPAADPLERDLFTDHGDDVGRLTDSGYVLVDDSHAAMTVSARTTGARPIRC